MEKEKIPFFKKMFYSITKFEYYPSIVKEGLGRAFLYLVIISLIFGLIEGISIGYTINKGVASFTEEVEKGLPDFTLENGQLEVQGKMPMVLDENDESIFIIDVSGQTTPDILDNYNEGILILKDKVIQKRNFVETRVYRFGDYKDFTITKDKIMGWLPILKGIGIIIGILTFLFFIIRKMFSALILAVIGLIISSIQKVKLSFGQLYSIGIYVLTLPIILDTFISLSTINFPWYLYYGLAIIYMWLSIKMFNNTPTVADDINSESIQD